MNFTDIFIRRPVFAMSLSIMILVIGLAAFAKMSVREYPKIETSVITVTTTYPGASAELMSGFVTTPLESAIGSVDGIDYMTSTNVQNMSQITVNLQLGYPMEKAITDVGNQISSVRWKLPKDVQDPVIAKQDPNAQPTVYIAFNSDQMNSEQVTDYLLRVVQPQIETLDGVSQAEILGEREYAMRINLDPQKMSALNISPNDVMKALQSNNLQAAAGRVEGELQEFNVTANTDMATPAQFNNMVIKQENNYIVRLKDVGVADLGAKDYRSSAIIGTRELLEEARKKDPKATSGKETVVIGVIPTSDANPLNVSKEVQKILPVLQEHMPKDLKASITYDTSLFISTSIKEVYETMAEAAFFVLLVIFLFLGSLRAVVIPIVTIPLSLIGVCGIMLALGYSINTITLLAWVLAIGLVVDDAIVVLENIHRHIEEGLRPIPASIIGAREIGFAIIAMTLTLAAVYAPIGFTGGLTGILFREFAFTLAAAVVVSGFIALTLSPMMCSRMLKHDSNEKSFARIIDKIFEKVVVAYKFSLRMMLKLRYFIILFALAMYALCWFLWTHTHEELAPIEDQGVVLFYITGPSSINIKYTEKYTSEMIPTLENTPEMESYGIINGFSSVNSAVAFMNLIPWDERKRSAQDISAAIFPAMWAIPGLKIAPISPSPLPATGGIMPIEFVIQDPIDIDKLNVIMQDMMKAATQNPGFVFVDTDMKLDKPQVHLVIDRNKAGDLGISMQEIATALNIMFGEPQNVQFSREGRSYYVIPELTSNFDYIASPEDINNIYVHSASGGMVPLSSVLTITETVEPQSLNHFQQLPSATLIANFAQGYTTSQALEFLEGFMKENYPEVQYDFGGQTRQYVQSLGAMTQVLIFAVIFIFLMLAAQFESFRDPVIVLFVVPLTMAGALITLNVTGGTMNIYSKIGLVTLVGLIAKHGILIVEFANQLQLKGMSKIEAVVESASLRLRPILMTTGAMVLGVIPLALATGAGAAARNQIGWVIAGGMTIGTFFSLYVVPSIYAVIAEAKFVDEALENEIQEAVAKAEQMKAEEEAAMIRKPE